MFSHYAKKNAPADDARLPTLRLGDPSLPVPTDKKVDTRRHIISIIYPFPTVVALVLTLPCPNPPPINRPITIIRAHVPVHTGH